MSWFDEAVRKAFDQSDELVMEIMLPDDSASIQAAMVATGVNPAGPTLIAKLPEEKRESFGKALVGLGLPATSFDRFDPWLASITLTSIAVNKLGYSADNGSEKALTAAAKAAGKPVSGLETPEQQFGFFDSLSEPAQITLLTETVDQLDQVGTLIGRMVDEWAAGKPEKLAKTMNEGMETTPELAKILLADRNQRWAKWIERRMERPGTVFIAVGAGHLAGKNSVQQQLRSLRLKAKRVRY